MAACDICFIDYDSNKYRPVVGTCGHSFCKRCSRKIDGICPKCRERSFDNPKTNFGMLELIEAEKKRKKQEEKNLLRALEEMRLNENKKQVQPKEGNEDKTVEDAGNLDFSSTGQEQIPSTNGRNSTKFEEHFNRKLISEGRNPVKGELFLRILRSHGVFDGNGSELYFGDILQITHKPLENYWIAQQVFDVGPNNAKFVLRQNFKEPHLIFQVVKRHFDESPRPIAVLGALKKKFMRHLVKRKPDLKGRIFPLSPNAIRCMHLEKVYPIVIFIGPTCRNDIINLSKGKMSEEKAKEELEKVRELAKEKPLFTERIFRISSFEDTISRALEHIEYESYPDYWIPSEDQSAIFS